MPKVRILLNAERTHAVFQCPGCGNNHGVTLNGERNVCGASWGWNGSRSRPTFTPSILMRSGHYAEGRANPERCWCTFNAEHPDNPSGFKCEVCHSFVRDGRIEFLTDCTHALAGQTVDLPEFDYEVADGE